VLGTAKRFAVEAIVSIDGRGQMVLPKAVRDRMGLNAGDKLAISVMESDGKPCCLTLIRTEELADRVRDIVGPAVVDIQ
jgi:AbrB family looped-hinge helix DNA binding protein